MVNYTVTPSPLPNEGIMFVDHQSVGRSGHMSHALVEYKKGHVLAFYSNCSRNRNNGHSGFGWIEYKRSADSCESWSAPQKLEYSWDAFLNEPFTV
ncbi:MAG: exo-alpha-sialidase, partial [Clostridia bacterium]|nr:exo-alpha-sialidase [Clostridia bacterium]